MASGVVHLIPGEQWAGAEVQAVTLIERLRARRVDVRAVVFHHGPVERALAQRGIDVTVLDQRALPLGTCIARLRERLQSLRPAVVHAHRYRETVLAAALAWPRSGPPLVRTVHGLPETYEGWRGIKMAAYHRLEGAAIRTSRATLIAVSESVASYLRGRFPRAPVYVVPNGIDGLSFFSGRGRSALRREWGVEDHAPVVGFVGRLVPVKGPDLFLQAVIRLQRDIPSLHAVMVGEGDQRRALERQAAGAGWRGIRFLGHRDDVTEILGAIDVLVMPSRNEGLPMILLEAMAAGRPIVAAAVGGIPEVAVNGESAFLVPSGSVDALVWATRIVLGNPERAASLGRAARAAVLRYTAGHMAERMMTIYERVRTQ